MTRRFLREPKRWGFLCCLLLSLQPVMAQFVELTEEIEITEWRPGHLSAWTTQFRCVVGTNSWQIDSDFGRNNKATCWFTGTNLVESVPGPRVMASVDGNPGLPVRQADHMTLPGRIAWLAFCSGPAMPESQRPPA